MCYRNVPKNVDHTFQLQPCGVQGILYINAKCDIVYTASYGIYKVACVIGVPTAAIEIAPMDCLSKRLLLTAVRRAREAFPISRQSDASVGKGRSLHYDLLNTAWGPTAKRNDGRKDALGTP